MKHEGKLPKRIVEITGITLEMIQQDGIALDDAMRQFCEFVGEHRVVFFNAAFDTAFLEHASARCGVPFKNLTSCALDISRRAWPGERSYRLVDLANKGNLNTSSAHRALKDCELTITVYAAAAVKLRRID